MSSPPSDDDRDEATVLRTIPPRPPARGSESSAPPAAPARATRFADTTTGDPHAPTLSAGSLASGAQGVGNALPIGSYLGEFELTQVVGEGGFGIVYLALDHSLQRRVALKEYMPSSLAERTSGMQVSSLSPEDEETFRKGLDSFINEARLLAQFDHPSLVKVHRFWEANGTAYMVMPFYEGPTLKETLRDMAQPPDEAWLLGLLDPLTQALAVIHANQCYHRDIAPDNILLLSGSGRPLLLDFGAARRVIGDANQALTVILKPGYAPLEQYAEVPGMKQGPWTDVYALAAVLYFAITGKKPPAAVGRLLNDQYVPLQQVAAGRYSAGFLAAIDRALAVKPADRTQDIDAFRADLGLPPIARQPGGAIVGSGGAPSMLAPAERSRSGPAAAGSATASAAGGQPSLPAAGGSRRMLGIGLAVAGLAVAGGAGWWLSRPAPAPTAAAPPPAAAPAQAPATAPAAAPADRVATAPAPAPTAAPPTAPPPPFSVVGEFQRIVAAQTPGFGVEARMTKPSVKMFSDVVSLTITSARDGWFYVLIHAPDGALIQFFPSQRAPTNRIRAGESITLPRRTNDPKTGLQAVGLNLTEPAGRGQMLVIVSEHPRDFGLLGDKRIEEWLQLPTGEAAEQIARRQTAGGSIYAGRVVCPGGTACADDYGAALVEFNVVR